MSTIDNKDSYYLTLNLVFLLIFGLIMVFSSSYIYAKENFGYSSYFFVRQLFYSALGTGLLLSLSKVPFQWFYRHSYKFHLAVFLLVIATFIPGLGVSAKGASRWISIMGFGFQPGELLKYSVLLTSVHYFQNFHFFSTRERWIKFAILLLPSIVLLLQPDFGMFFICCFNILFVCFMSDFSRKYFALILLVGLGFIGSVVMLAPYRMKRLLTYLDPWADPLNSGFQIIQSFLGFANGHIIGQGLGNSNEKLFYLPEAHNDFILSVVGEELGFVGVFIVILGFLSLTYYGFKMAIKCRDAMRVVFGVAAITSLAFQAFLNMAVVLGLLPTKGLTLPFISYGGSAMVANFVLLGVFYSACSQATSTEASQENPELIDNKVYV